MMVNCCYTRVSLASPLLQTNQQLKPFVILKVIRKLQGVIYFSRQVVNNLLFMSR